MRELRWINNGRFSPSRMHELDELFQREKCDARVPPEIPHRLVYWVSTNRVEFHSVSFKYESQRNCILFHAMGINNSLNTLNTLAYVFKLIFLISYKCL